MLSENTRRTRQGGFTLIELVIVIIILGILAAVAVPQFLDLSEEAEDAAVNAQAGALSAANSLNVAACALDKDECDDTITECSDASGLVQNFDDDQYSIVDDGSGASFALTDTSDGIGDPIVGCGVVAD